MSILVDPDLDPAELRGVLYRGGVVVLTRLGAVGRLVDHARRQLADLFAPHDPRHAHEHFDAVEMADMLGSWKPAFIHSTTSTDLVRAIVEEAGFPPEGTHYDLPKPRTSFPVGHLTTGIAYAFPWHRDLWYGAPAQQINWWLPVLGADEDNSMSFDLQSFDRQVPNSSGGFDYYQNNRARRDTASQVGHERQARPAALHYRPAHELVVLPPPGSILLFAGAHLHRSVPNTSARSRFSVDFRTVDVADVVHRRGAPAVDVMCSGTSIRDFRRVVDDRTFDEDLVRQLYGPPPSDAMLIFSPGAGR
ncbi:MAG TPA: hypothetical protein VGL60_03980 [Acidimicrobiales bacterium]|jgi:hypothetical protein